MEHHRVPRGTRSTDGWLQRFRHGTSRLALDMKMPVVPIAIVGAYAAMPKGRSWPRRGRPPIRVRYGRPIEPREGETHQQLSLRMQQGVAELFDEDRTSWWEAARRAAKDETPSLAGPVGPGWLRTWRARARSGAAASPRRGSDGGDPLTRQGGEVRRHALIEEAIRAFGREGYSGASWTRSPPPSGSVSRRSSTTSRPRTLCWRRASRRQARGWPRRSRPRSRGDVLGPSRGRDPRRVRARRGGRSSRCSSVRPGGSARRGSSASRA